MDPNMEPDEAFVTYLSPELRKLNDDVVRSYSMFGASEAYCSQLPQASDSDTYEKWEALVTAAEQQEQGLSRNSSPNAIAAYRGVYNRFLAKFPLFFGYWRKYADVEFAIAGTEAAEMVRELKTSIQQLEMSDNLQIYERGIASIPTSVDLWVSYCGFKCETTHDPEPIRE